MINVTSPFLPPKEEYQIYLDKIYKKNWLTNMGPLSNELEIRLKDYLGTKNLLYVGNGTIALQLAIKALNLSGEIITTPFSYVATTSSIVWEQCIPVFADINEKSFNIDPHKIEVLISERTTAILATHVFGNPCDIESIEKIAEKHDLKVIYDAAHCFGVNYKGQSIFNYGDISTVSFHATKLFHTIEGGAVITQSKELDFRLTKMRNFGHVTSESFDGMGINAKNSEFHAAMGLCNLKYIEGILKKRKDQYINYLNQLKGCPLGFQQISDNTNYNYAYFPVVFDSETIALKVKEKLQDNWIGTRRYFYPSLSNLEYVKSYKTPIADSIASRILCLPVFHELSEEDQDFICYILKSTLTS